MNFKTVRCCFILLALALSSSLIVCDGDEKIFKRFCDIGIDSSPSELNVDGDEYFCECEMIATPLVGKPTIKIDCTFNDRIANLTNKFFGAENLPTNTATLVLSFQLFTEIPQFVGRDLKHLDISNNRIAIVKDSDFIHVKMLDTLQLNDNEITIIEPRAFAPLTHLQNLDLSSNQLVVVPANVFAPVIRLDTLFLSSNEGFGRINGKNAANSSLTLLYLQLGVTRNLKHLEMARCNLTSINLAHGDDLEFLNLAFNEIRDTTKLEFPQSQKLKHLTLSGNPFRYLRPNSLKNLHSLEELLMEDLPYFGEVDEYAFFGLPRMRLLSLEGSKNLSSFNEKAFGVNAQVNETDLQLEVLNLRGCNLRTLNSSLYAVFENVKVLSLDGNPFNCDCEVQWLSEIGLDKDLRCYRPEEFQGMLLSEISEDEEELKCSKMSRFMGKLLNSLILIALLVICSVTIWLVLRQLRPDSRRKRLSKIGPDSPYQRVTIDVNRAEYSLY